MKFIALVPSKLNSARLKEKNIQELNGKPLLNHVIDTLEKVPLVEKIILQSSTDEILKFLSKDYSKVEFQKRPINLDLDEATPQDWIRYFCESYECEYIVLLHITSPFINNKTITECIKAISSKKYDSCFAAIEYHNFAWFKGVSLNYNSEKPIPRTQDLEPIVLEQTGFYIINREYFLATNSRIGNKPFIKFLEFPESLDIDTLEDLQMARFVLKSGIYKV